MKQRHRWKSSQMKNGRLAKITDKDGMKDTGKNLDFKILFDTDNLK